MQLAIYIYKTNERSKEMNGLSSSEVLRSREMHGSNKLPEPKMKKWYDFAKEALSEKITMILIAIAVLQLFLGFMGVMELSDPIMILVVLAIVTVIAVKTGLGVQKSAAELRAKTSVRYCDVIRDGKVQTINKDELVVGDLVCVGMGQEIFADGYIVDGKISVNNAAINGETKECKKTPIQGYIHAKTTSTSAYTNPNCLFAGTTVMSGEGKMIVTDVGVNTVNGDTMVKMQTLESPKTALDIALDNLSDFISKWGTVAAVVTFAVLTMTGIMSVGFSNYFGGNVLDVIQKIAQNFSVALTIIVAAVPEGLPLIVKLVTKQNVRTMETFNILAKNPGKIPELAYVDIITLAREDGDKEKFLVGETFMTRAELDEYKCSTLREGEYTCKKLTRTYVKNGKTTEEYDKLADVLASQKYYLESLEKLSEERKRLEFPHRYKVNLSNDLRELKYSLIDKISEELNEEEK